MHPNADHLIATRFDTVLYDLDGTLIESAKDMQVAVIKPGRVLFELEGISKAVAPARKLVVLSADSDFARFDVDWVNPFA